MSLYFKLLLAMPVSVAIHCVAHTQQPDTNAPEPDLGSLIEQATASRVELPSDRSDSVLKTRSDVSPTNYNIFSQNAQLGEIQYFYGPEWRKTYVYNSQTNQEELVPWESLTPEQYRSELDDSFEGTQVFEVDSNGSISLSATIPPGAMSGAVSGTQKTYRIVYNNFRFNAYDCSPDEPLAGQVLVGVGVRTIIDARAQRRRFAISLPFFALDLSKRNYRGSIKIYPVGLANSSTLSSVVSEANREGLSYEGLTSANIANAVTNQVFEDMSPQTPRIIGFIDNKEVGYCLSVLNETLKSINGTYKMPAASPVVDASLESNSSEEDALNTSNAMAPGDVETPSVQGAGEDPVGE